MKKLAMIGLLILCTGCGIEQVDEGYRGIEMNWGKVVGDPLNPGLYFYNPISTNIFEMEVREIKVEGKEPSFTRDTQIVTVAYAVTFYPEPSKIGEIYTKFGMNWFDKVVSPSIRSSLKDAIGQYKADFLVQNRNQAQKDAFDRLTKTLSPRDVHLTQLDFTNLDFRDEYENAVEAKVVAVQRAEEAKNKTVQIREQARQTVLTAKADAEAMQIKTRALSQSKALVDYEAVKRWDGKLPQYMFGSTVPMIKLQGLK